MRTLLWLGMATVISTLPACSSQVSGESGGSGGTSATTGGGGPIGVGAGPVSDGGGPGTGGSGGAGGAGGSGAAGGSGGSGGVGGAGDARPPAPGPSHPGDGDGAVFAISKIYIGDTDRDGTHDPHAWANFGYDVDGQITACVGNQCQAVTHHCKPAAGGSPANAYPDGKHGIDNSFGRNIVPVLLAIQSDTAQHLNQGIAAGDWTVLFDVQALGAGDEYSPLSSLLYVGAPLGHAPAFDGSDAWPVRPEGLTDPNDVTSSKENFPTSYVVGNTWVSGAGGHIVVPFDLMAPGELDLDIGAAVASFEMSPDHASATNGTISGVLDTEAFVAAFRRMAGAIDPSLCSGSTIDSISNQIRQASDIMKDGSPGTSSVTCDGISIGLGFDAKPVVLGGVGAPTNTPDPCGP